jgi:hypothetical protein
VDPERYGPFANIVAIALALTATFSVLLLKTFGRARRWTFLIDESPSFIVTGGIRALTIVFMSAAYLLVDPHNYLTFLGVAALFGVIALVLIARFDLQRRVHVISRPLLADDGSQLHQDGRKVAENIVIGTEGTMRPQAREDFAAAQRNTHGLSLETFLSGYGVKDVYETAAVWDRETLASMANRLSLLLMGAFLSGVLALFLAALCVAVTN